jgi:hypothetical protein
MTSWCGVSAEELERYWPQAFNLVARACARSNGRLTPEAVFADLKAKQMQLWLVHTDGKIEACFVTQIINYPGTRLCNILLAAGKGRQRWQHWISILEDWAREQGCNGMESVARLGWKRILRGWRHTKILIERDL